MTGNQQMKSLDQFPDAKDSDRIAQAKLLRRQVQLQEESAEAAKEAVQVAVQTAMYTKQVAQYMLWSVIGLTFSLILTTLLNVIK